MKTFCHHVEEKTRPVNSSQTYIVPYRTHQKISPFYKIDPFYEKLTVFLEQPLIEIQKGTVKQIPLKKQRENLIDQTK